MIGATPKPERAIVGPTAEEVRAAYNAQPPDQTNPSERMRDALAKLWRERAKQP